MSETLHDPKTHGACPLCGGHLDMRYQGIPDRLGTSPGRYRLDECRDCGFGLINPAPTGDLSRYYPTHYLSQEGETSQPGLLSRLERAYRYDQYRFDFDLLKRVTGIEVGSISSYVDIGCGSGERVSYVSERGCQRAVGVDRYKFDKASLRDDIQLVNSAVESFRPEDRFDLVSMFHVLEHVEDPVDMLRHLRAEVVAPHGVLQVQVPNYGSFERKLFGRRWFGLDAPRHLFQFDARTLRMAVDQAGFEVVAVMSANAPLHPVTLVPSAFPGLDPQRIWVRSGSALAKLALQILWAGSTLAAIPLARLQDLTRNASMLTVVARPRR